MKLDTALNNHSEHRGRNIPEVTSDFNDEIGEGVGSNSILMSIWGSAKKIYAQAKRSSSISDITNDVQDEVDGENCMTSRSIFVGTLVRGKRIT